MIKLFNFFILIIFAVSVSAQGELLEEQEVFFEKEKVYYFKANTNGVGAGIGLHKRITFFKRRIFGLELNYIKSYKEYKVQNEYYNPQKKFIFGKINNVLILRGYNGIYRELFSKQDKDGIAIGYSFIGGISFAFLKPIYYEVVDSIKIRDNIKYIYTSYKKFNSSIHQPNDIYGKAPFIIGINEIKISPGFFCGTSALFNFSNDQKKIRILETGLLMEYFIFPVQIMFKNPNEKSKFYENRFFVTLSLIYKIGNVILKHDL